MFLKPGEFGLTRFVAALMRPGGVVTPRLAPSVPACDIALMEREEARPGAALAGRAFMTEFFICFESNLSGRMPKISSALAL